MKLQYLGYDCETEYDENVPAAPMVCGQFCLKGQRKLLRTEGALDKLEAALCNDSIVIVGHHTAFDFVVAVQERPHLLGLILEKYRKGLVRCTMQRQRLLNIRTGGINIMRLGRKIGQAKYSLGFLAKAYLGRVMDKDEDGPQKRFGEVKDLPISAWPQEFVDYALGDAGTPLDVHLCQSKIVGAKLVSPDEHLQTYSAFCLELERMRGVCVDAQYRDTVHEDLLNKYYAIQLGLKEFDLLKQRKKTDITAGFSVTQQKIKDLIQEAIPQNTPRNDPTEAAKRKFGPNVQGSIKTDKETIELACALGGNEVLLWYRAYKGLEKTLGYLNNLTASPTTFRLHTRPNNLVNTGRTSWSGPSLQNLPQAEGVRECIVPPDGYVLLAADYDSLELRSLAQVFLDLVGHSVLADKYRDDPGFDPHSQVASQMFGCSYEEGLALKGTDKRFKMLRRLAKALNFGLPGGMGVDSFIKFAFSQYDIQLGQAEVKRLKQQWFGVWTEARRYFQLISNMEGRDIVQLRSGRVRGRPSYCARANSFFQGLAADGAKEGLILMTEDCYTNKSSPLYGCEPVVFVHDEHILYVPEDRVHEAGERLVQLMIQGMNRYIPDIPIRAEALASTRWSKNAQRIIENGRLVAHHIG